MTEGAGSAERLEGMRRRAVAALDEVVSKAHEFELAEPPPVLAHHRRKLAEDSYEVLVVGEAKRGKSTFVNALIGQDLLPTDVEVATSQVFNVRPSAYEAYRVRFEDGSALAIGREDLPLYGSQVAADAGIAPTLDQTVRWIEVDAPIRFLPRGVSILDTPGLGALYAGHARITHRFVPMADAVIFVLESGQPAVEDDLAFVEEILTVTRNVFFVQTKIDQHNAADWQSVQRRNQEILKDRFGDRLADTRVWPVSSTNLRKAALAPGQAQEEAYLMVSRHKELMAALKAFLARASGWGRTAEAMAVAARYHIASRKTLQGRVTGLAAESEQRQAELQQAAVEGKRRFDAEWGPQGEEYKRLREGLSRAIAIGKQSFSNTLQPGGDVETVQKLKIDAVVSLPDANRVSDGMGGEVVTAATNDWVRICKEVQYQCLALLGPFAEAANKINAPLNTGLSGLRAADDGDESRFKTDYMTMVRGATSGGMMLTGAASILGLQGLGIGLASAATLSPIALVAAPVLIGLVVKGVTSARAGQVKQAQAQLRQQLGELLQKVRRHFFNVDLTAGQFSRVDEYFSALERTINEEVRGLVARKSRESQAEITRLQDSAHLDGRERQVRTKQAQDRLAGWDETGKTVGAIIADLKALRRPRPAPQPAGQGVREASP